MSDIHILNIKDRAYPKLLREIHNPPQQLYIRGNIALLSHSRLLAVVGSRQATAYGAQALHTLLSPAIEKDIPIVSGLALGIDSLAHELCVKMKRPTIAVLGTGIDDAGVYPRQNLTLAHAILKFGGVLVSEYPIGTKVFKGNFPARNRIIVGLCAATLVIEAAEKSGSLISARLAMESNREVLAVPGPITELTSVGTNQLIHDGATPALHANDLLEIYQTSKQEVSLPLPISVL
ncbi:MAG: DNA-processing protein DprA [Candidatus Andersenbacteria bacterium]